MLPWDQTSLIQLFLEWASGMGYHRRHAACLIGEPPDASQRPVSMPHASGAIALSMTIGPALGGLLAKPTEHFPAVFSSDGFFAR